MNFVFCLVVFGAVAIAHVSATTGRSACGDPSEVGQCYPHHIKHASYWCCEELNVAATERTCAPGNAYMHLLRECIPWANWFWKQPQNPPTLYNEQF